MTDPHAIVQQVEALDSERVKTLVLDWLSGTSESLNDFERLLESHSHNTNAALEYGQIDETLAFHPIKRCEI